MEPAVVKTVSYFKLSVLVRSKASALLMNESFLQELLVMLNTTAAKNKKQAFFITANLQFIL